MLRSVTYKISTVVLLGLLAASSGTGVYLYQLQAAALNSEASQSADLNNQVSNLKDQLDSLRAEMESLRSEVSSSADQIMSLKAQVAQLQAQVTQLQEQISQLQAMSQQLGSEIQQLQIRVQQLETLVQELQSLIEQLLSPIILNGAGATFPSPLLSAMGANYTRTHPTVQLNYQAVGSGAGIRAFAERAADFALRTLP